MGTSQLLTIPFVKNLTYSFYCLLTCLNTWESDKQCRAHWSALAFLFQYLVYVGYWKCEAALYLNTTDRQTDRQRENWTCIKIKIDIRSVWSGPSLISNRNEYHTIFKWRANICTFAQNIVSLDEAHMNSNNTSTAHRACNYINFSQYQQN